MGKKLKSMDEFITETDSMSQQKLVQFINDETTTSKLMLCVAIAKLKHRYFTDEDFSVYLEEATLDQAELDRFGGSNEVSPYRPQLLMPKSTASEYATMGGVYLILKENLEAAGFDPSVDMKKLLILNKVLASKDAALLADATTNIRKMSYVAFKEKYLPPKKSGGVKRAEIALYKKETRIICYQDENVLQLFDGFCEAYAVGLDDFVGTIRKLVDTFYSKKCIKMAHNGISENNPISDTPKEAA